jgi:EAL domain-containing protein (putative c-di-GMP-specific phosphodiesterase class I)
MTSMSPLQEIKSHENGRLLVIDDDRMQRMLIGEVGRRNGFAVDVAATTEEAFEALATNDYATVAVDLSLGESDGVEIIRYIASTGQRPAIIVISGFDERIRDAAIRFGASLGLSMVGELRKPVDLGQLRSCLARRPTGSAPTAGVAAETARIRRDEIADALARGEIIPHYQPKVSLQSGRTVGVEALARWTSRQHGGVSPSIFVPLAEEYGLADLLTRSMLKQALGDAAAWAARGHNVGVAVNVPAGSLLDAGFPDLVEAELAAAGLQSSLLTIEVTESTAMSEQSVTSGVLTRLRIKGVQLALDDFGTGYSSLSSLLRMPFGELKIDKSFVQACDRDSYAWKIVRATLSLAREFGMTTVAEGVETSTVAAMLRMAQCDIAQGYHYSRPLTRAALEARLASESQDDANARRIANDS